MDRANLFSGRCCFEGLAVRIGGKMKNDLVEREISNETAGVNVEKVGQNESELSAVDAWKGGKLKDALFGKLPVMVAIFHRSNKEVELRYVRISNPIRIERKDYFYDPYAIERYGAFACVSIYESDPYAYYPEKDPELTQERIKELMQLEIMNRAKLQARKQSKWDYVMQYVLIGVIVVLGVLLWLK